MSDKKDLKWDESAFSETDDLAVDEPGGDWREPLRPAEGKKKGSSTRILLLILLLVVAVAGAFFYFGLSEEPEVAAPAPVKKQPIAMPVPVAPPVPATETQPVAGTAQPVAVAAPVTAKVEAAPAGPAAMQTESATGPVAKKAQPGTEAVAVTPQPAAPVAKVEAPTPTPMAAPVAKAAAAPVGKYTVDAGSFLLDANRREAEKVIGALGYPAEAVTVKRPIQMVRLRVGSYPPADAEAKRAAISSFAPGAFTLPRGEEVVVYAGSYLDLDKARAFADRLFLNGVEVEEEKAEVPMKLVRITFGSFPDQEAARQAAARAQSAGLNAVVVGR